MKYLLLITFLFSCESEPRKAVVPQVQKDFTSQQSVNGDTPTISVHGPHVVGDDTIPLSPFMNRIFMFPEVEEVNKQISKTSQRKHGVSIMVRNGFNGDTGYYNFMVGDNSHEDRWANIFNFLVEKKTGQIKVYDMVSDSIMTLRDWRKTRR